MSSRRLHSSPSQHPGEGERVEHQHHGLGRRRSRRATTVVPLWSGNEKSGAGWPISMAMVGSSGVWGRDPEPTEPTRLPTRAARVSRGPGVQERRLHAEARTRIAPLDALVGGVGDGGVAGPEVGGGDARARRSGPRRSSRAWPTPARSAAADERRQQRVVERGRRTAGARRPPRRSSPSSSAGASTARTWASASAGVRSGANRWLSATLDAIGHDVAGHAALDLHGLERLAVLAALRCTRLARLVGRRRWRARGPSAVDGVATHPGPGGVGPLAARG